MAWIILIVAGLLEICWAIGLKYSAGFTRLWPSVFTIFTSSLSFFLLGVALKRLPVGTGYTVWVGIGAIGTAIFGILLFNEPISFGRISCIALIVIGVVGLKLHS